jgi:hypothetical protein
MFDMLNMCVNEARIVTCIVNYTRTDGGGGGANIILLGTFGHHPLISEYANVFIN